VPVLKRILNGLFLLAAIAVAGLVARHFAHTGWPLKHANFWLVALAGIVMLAAYLTKAWGWQRLFRQDERPAVLTLAAAGGAASVGGIALPGRCDEVLRVAVVRRCRRKRASFGAVALSLFLLGLLDSAALAPLAGVAIGVANVGGWLQVGLIVIAVAGVLAAGLVFALPRLTRFHVVSRFRVGRWIGANSTEPREATWAWGAIAVSCTCRRGDAGGSRRRDPRRLGHSRRGGRGVRHRRAGAADGRGCAVRDRARRVARAGPASAGRRGGAPAQNAHRRVARLPREAHAH
jgi:hypothetical protein